MDLDKLTVRMLRALLVTSSDSTAGANHRVCRLAVNQSGSPGSHDHSVGGKGFQFECLQVHGDQAATDLRLIEHQRHHFPVFKLANFPGGFVASYLFVKRLW